MQPNNKKVVQSIIEDDLNDDGDSLNFGSQIEENVVVNQPNKNQESKIDDLDPEAQNLKSKKDKFLEKQTKIIEKQTEKTIELQTLIDKNINENWGDKNEKETIKIDNLIEMFDDPNPNRELNAHLDQVGSRKVPIEQENVINPNDLNVGLSNPKQVNSIISFSDENFKKATSLTSSINPRNKNQRVKTVNESKVNQKTIQPNELLVLENNFNENFKKIIDSIVQETQNSTLLPDISGTNEKAVRKRMQDYFKNQNLDNMKQELFFTRWTEIRKQGEQTEEDDRQINFSKNNQKESMGDLRSNNTNIIKPFDKNSLKVISCNPESSWSNEFEQQFIQPGEELLDILPFCPTVVVLKKRKTNLE